MNYTVITNELLAIGHGCKNIFYVPGSSISNFHFLRRTLALSEVG